MNIVYRVVHCLLALAVFPAIFFLQLIYMEVSPTFLDYGMSIDFSIKKLIDLFGGSADAQSLGEFFSAESLSNFWSVFEPARVKLVFAIIFFAITVIAAIFIVVASIVKGCKKVLLAASSTGLISTIVFMVLTNSVMNAVERGDINIIRLFSQGFIGGIVGFVISVDKLVLGSFANAVLMLFIAMVLWTLIYIVTDIGLEEAPAANDAAAAKKKKK